MLSGRFVSRTLIPYITLKVELILSGPEHFIGSSGGDKTEPGRPLCAFAHIEVIPDVPEYPDLGVRQLTFARHWLCATGNSIERHIIQR
ncbi:hypothetical protein FJMB80017_49120 (plasmid) [Enterobacter hormaechei]|nr:hypothetical protein FJMB80001_48500 [Enterobacter hormaechei]BDJ34920.1 hypothetical protein FJMB80017_49120 [Enterobacter hormaechei]BDJ88682.1 hypothetical protein FJMB80066_48710 [Enterobacter hormaechei]GKX06768.1 hypothetical protein FJMB80284_48850 [Enterobacter hormaechei]